jgi:hypothetical protein
MTVGLPCCVQLRHLGDLGNSTGLDRDCDEVAYEVATPNSGTGRGDPVGLRERVLSQSAAINVVNDEPYEVLIAVTDHDVLDGGGGRLAWPGGLPCRPVAVEPGTRGGDPVVKTLAGVGEVAVPAEGCGAVLVGVVGAEPVQVECGEFPDKFGVAVPERRND